MNARSLAVVALVVLGGCSSGGGGSAAAPVPNPTATPTPAPSATPAPTGRHQNAKLTFSFRPRAKNGARTPRYVSPNSSVFQYTIVTVNGSTTIPSWVPASGTVPLTTAPPNGNCTLAAGTETCTVSVPAPVGSVEYQFAITDGTNVLSANQVTESISQGVDNSFTVTLEGLVHTIRVSTSAPLAVQAASGSYSQTLTVEALDADDNQIVGSAPYANPFTITDPESSTSQATTLTLNGGTAGTTATVSSPSDVVVLDYTGQAINSFAVTASGAIPGGGTVACSSTAACTIADGTPNDVILSGTAIDSTANGGLNTDPNYGQQTVFFSQTSGSQAVGASEVGFTGGGYAGTFEISLDPATCGSGAGAVASVSPNPGPQTSFTVTAKNVGTCKAKIAEYGATGGYPLTTPGHTANVAGSPTHDGTFWISVTSSSIGVDKKYR